MPKLAYWLFAFWCLTVSACSKKGIPAPTGGADVPPSKVNLRRAVELVTVEERNLISYVETVGTIEPESISDIAAGVSGIVDEVLFREGDIVDPYSSQPLVKIDQKRFRTALSVAEAAIKEAKANTNAARDASQRAQQSGGAIAAELRIQAAEALVASEAKLLSAQAMYDLAELNNRRSQVHAPFKGQINKRMVAPGQFVEDKTVIASMADLSRIRISAYIPESSAALVRRWVDARDLSLTCRYIMANTLASNPWLGLYAQVGTALGEIPSGYDPEFTLPAFPNRLFRARIFFMSKVADPTTHMFECKAEIDPRTPYLSDIIPGYTAKIRFPVETKKEAIIVPEESIRATERGFMVFVPAYRTLPDGKKEWVAKARRIEIGTRNPGNVEIREGLSRGEAIVRKGAEALEDGTPIRFDSKWEARLSR